MLKIRVIPCLTIKEERLVKSVQFSEHRNIGNIVAAVRVFNARDVDEMVFLDLDASRRGIRYDLIAEVARECFMPLAIGGGVKTMHDFSHLLEVGADKVVINSTAINNPGLIREAASRFGSQCVVVSIDVRRMDDDYEVFGGNGLLGTGRGPMDWAREVEALGAGEILLTSIDRDGVMEGYDIELVKQVSCAVRIPTIACGGAGKLEDFERVIVDGGASAVAAASIFQYTQATPMSIKRYLALHDIDTRISVIYN